MQIGRLWRERQGVAKHALAFGIPIGGSIEIGQVHRRRREVRLELARRQILGFRADSVATFRIVDPQVDVRTRRVGVECLHGQPLRDALIAPLAIAGLERRDGERSGRFDPHGTR